MDWFLYDRDPRRERVKDITYTSKLNLVYRLNLEIINLVCAPNVP